MLLPFLAAVSISLSANPACSGRLEGAVQGTFACEASVVDDDQGRTFLVIAPTGPIPGVPSYVPGTFEITGVLRPGTYTLDQLGAGRASVAAENRTLYTATKTTGQRGEVTLVVKSVEPDPARPGGRRIHGTYRARLLPAGGGKSGEVLVFVEF